MLNSIRAKVFAAVFLGLAAVLAPVRQAGAAIYIGTFDPSFGGSLGNLGFRGQATFFIPDACVGLAGSLVSNLHPCSGGAMSMTAATVELYRFIPSPPTPQPTLATATFAPPAEPLIDALFGSGGALLGVNTLMVGPQVVNVNDGVEIYAGNLWLEFHQPAPFSGSDVVSTFAVSPFAAAGAYLFACDPTVTTSCSQIQSNVALVEFTRVAEPATAGLVLLAIAGIVLVRRRCGSQRL